MTDREECAWRVALIAGRLCLDFANTVDWHASERPGENLKTFDDLLKWSQHVGIMTKRDARTLGYMAANSPSKAERVLKRAVDLRETIYRIFSAVSAGSLPSDEDLAMFNENLSRASLRSRMVKTRNGLLWDWTGGKGTLDWMLNPVIRSAADLLVSDDLKRVKRCADPQCGWLFLDFSRNRSRRWCDMKDCGNRAKASRFYQRKKQG